MSQQQEPITLTNAPFAPTLTRPLTLTLRELLSLTLDEFDDASGWRYVKAFVPCKVAAAISVADPNEQWVHVESPQGVIDLVRAGILKRIETNLNKSLVWEIKDWKESSSLLWKRKENWKRRELEDEKRQRNIETLVQAMLLLMGTNMDRDFLKGKANTILNATKEQQQMICTQFNITLE